METGLITYLTLHSDLSMLEIHENIWIENAVLFVF